MRESLRAGIAIYNDGHYHAAHDAWEDHWLDLECDTHDERLLHGLIQFTAAIYHAHNRNWEGAVGLAESGYEYLEGLPEGYRGVDLEGVQRALDELGTDPEVIERRVPVSICHDGEYPTLASLSFDESTIAAAILAEAFGFEDAPIRRAIEYARTDLEAGEDDSRFITLVFDFVREDGHRRIVYDRLCQHVDRRRARETDVDGLFEPD